jgi:hypothetical protein
MFVRGTDQSGKQFQEFTAAINISAGGVLLVSRRYLPVDSSVSLEIPSAPLPRLGMAPDFIRNLLAYPVTVKHSDECYLVGMRFSNPLIKNNSKRSKRKEFSSV